MRKERVEVMSVSEHKGDRAEGEREKEEMVVVEERRDESQSQVFEAPDCGGTPNSHMEAEWKGTWVGGDQRELARRPVGSDLPPISRSPPRKDLSFSVSARYPTGLRSLMSLAQIGRAHV